MPVDLIARVGQVSAVSTGVDVTIEMGCERRVAAPDEIETAADVFGHQRARAFIMRMSFAANRCLRIMHPQAGARRPSLGLF